MIFNLIKPFATFAASVIAFGGVATTFAHGAAQPPAVAKPTAEAAAAATQPELWDILDCGLSATRLLSKSGTPAGQKVKEFEKTVEEARKIAETSQKAVSVYSKAQGIVAAFGKTYGDDFEANADRQADVYIILMGLNSCANVDSDPNSDSPTVAREALRGILKLTLIQTPYRQDQTGRVCLKGNLDQFDGKTLPELVPYFIPCPLPQQIVVPPNEVPFFGGSAERQQKQDFQPLQPGFIPPNDSDKQKHCDGDWYLGSDGECHNKTKQKHCDGDWYLGSDGECHNKTKQKHCDGDRYLGSDGDCHNNKKGSDGNDSCPNGMVRVSPETDTSSGCAPASAKQEDPHKQESKQEHKQEYKQEKKSESKRETQPEKDRPEKAHSGQSDSGNNNHEKKCDPDQEKCSHARR